MREHGINNPELTTMFAVLKKCQGKLDCLIHEMLFICERKPTLNTQSDSFRPVRSIMATFDLIMNSITSFDALRLHLNSDLLT